MDYQTDVLSRPISVVLPPAGSVILKLSESECRKAAEGLAVLADGLEAAEVKSDDIWCAFLFFRELIVQAGQCCRPDESNAEV